MIPTGTTTLKSASAALRDSLSIPPNLDVLVTVSTLISTQTLGNASNAMLLKFGTTLPLPAAALRTSPTKTLQLSNVRSALWELPFGMENNA